MRRYKFPTVSADWLKLEMPKSAVGPAVLTSVLCSFGWVLIASTQLFLVEQYVCREHYKLVEPATSGGGGGLIDEALCKKPEIQSVVASVMGTNSFLGYIPALLLTGSWSNLSKILGKKTVLFLNACSVAAQAIYYVAICYYQVNIRWIWATPLFDIIGGGQVILSSIVYTYLAESVDPKKFSSVLYKFSAIQLLSAFLSMSISSWMLRVNVWILCFSGTSAMVLIIPATLLFPPSPYTLLDQERQRNPSLSTCGPPSESDSIESTSLLSEDLTPQRTAFGTILNTLFSHYKHSFKLFKDIITSSPLSRLTLLTYFLLTFTTGIRTIFTQWASTTHHWSIASVHLLTSFEMVITALVLLSLPTLTTRLRTRQTSSAHVDILLSQTFLIFSFLGLLLMALAPNRPAYVAAITIYTFGNGVRDSLRSFSTGLLGGREEVERCYLGIGLVETLGGMAASGLWMGMYSRVVGRGWGLQRIPFWGALGGIVGLGCVVWRLGKFAERRSGVV